VASQKSGSACLVQAGGSLIFHCVSLKALPEMSLKCSMASLVDDVSEQLLLQSQSTFVAKPLPTRSVKDTDNDETNLCLSVVSFQHTGILV
jgi:hypothetical protein